MSLSILNEIFKLVCFDGIQYKKWQQCKDLDSQLQFIRDAIPLKLTEASKNSDYEALEKQVQKYEGEIRKHIRMEQQIKLYAEQLQQKLEEQENQEDIIQNLKNQIIQLKKEKEQFNELIKKLQIENQKLKQKLQEINEHFNSNQTSPIETKIKPNSRYQTINNQCSKTRQNSKNFEEYNKQFNEVKTQISNTIDSSLLKVLQNRRNSLKVNESYKNSQNSSLIDKADSTKLQSSSIQSRAASSTQQRRQSETFSQQSRPTENNINTKFDLKNNTDNYKKFLTTYNFLCQKNKGGGNTQQTRQNKSSSEHYENKTNQWEQYKY